jgi:non-specific serine/threonine protein kinase
VGKTRLALHAADALRGSFQDGVALVELAKLEDADLLESTVAGSLGLRGMGSEPMSALVDYLAAKRMLLVLDNCEHLLDACAQLVAALMRGTSRLRILATSRQSLGVYGEQVLVVPSLSVPESGDPLRIIARHEAVRLLVDRAASVRPGFALDPSNAAEVARLSQRLDGIPLAIELAAVRLRTRSVEQVMRELDGRFPALAGGSPSALPRHQTLRATMDWSFELCSPGERRLWIRFSMFATSVELETVEEVCSDAGIEREDIFDLVSGLVDKSLLIAEHGPGAMRYRMLESIRAYGRERLSPSEGDVLRRRYIGHYRDLVERCRLDHIVSDQVERYRTLVLELPNVRVALETSFSQPHAAPVGLEMASALWGYWILAGSLTEGRYWLQRGLGLVPDPGIARVTGLWTDCMLALHQGDLATAGPTLEECRALARKLGDERSLASAVEAEGITAFYTDDTPSGMALLDEARARFAACGDLDAVGINLFFASSYGAVEAPDRAAVLGEEFLEMTEDRHALVSQGYAQFAVGVAAWSQGDWRRAEALMREGAELRQAINDRWGLAQCLEVLAWTACVRGEHDRAAQVLGAAHALWLKFGASPDRMWPHARWHENCERESRQALGNRAFAAAFRGGGKAALDQVVAYAIRSDGEH